MARRGLVLGAAASGTGKTLVTLGLLSALKDRGVAVSCAKSGPDYIDPQFHTAACGAPSVNLDAWAMTPVDLCARAAAQPGDLLLVEGAMGVLDGAHPDGRGSTADLAEALGLPMILILDAAKAAHSLALQVAGFQHLRPTIPLAGVILNRVGSTRHTHMIRDGLQQFDIPILGSLPRSADLLLPERHLGLVQAAENPELEAFLNTASRLARDHIDLDSLLSLARPIPIAPAPKSLAPPGQRIAIARDIAFAFAYPHLLSDWQSAGATLMPFSPLADEPPDPSADAVFLPGGYPELHAGPLAAATRFHDGLRNLASKALIYGECGGFMTLGESLTDADGTTHAMTGLLPLTTSFAKRRLTLGYRSITHKGPLPWPDSLAAHEFHYATITHQGDAPPLFQAEDAAKTRLPDMGLQIGRTCGSFAHIIASDPSFFR